MFRRHREEPISRGQAMVEFAIILPLLALLLVMAVDFGRAFFGWVGVHNAARIAASEAAAHPDAWAPPGNVSGQNAYRRAVLNDLQALNCQVPAALDTDGDATWDLGEVPNPSFTNQATGFSAGDTYEVGDHAVVAIQCAFDLITPLAGGIVGDPLNIRAEAEFMVRGGEINGIPIVPPGPPAGCVDKVVPNMVGLSVAAARSSWSTAGFTGAFTPATGSDTDVVTSQATTPASSPNDCLVETASVTVTHAAGAPCTSPEVQVPSMLGLTVAQARSTWTANGFDAGTFSPASGSDTEIVTDQDTVPVTSPGDCAEPDTTVTVTHEVPPPPQCTMPQLIGKRVNQGLTDFNTAGFSGTYTVTRPPAGNYFITSQSLVAGQDFDCTAGVTVAGN
jgi:beta-lactam-binding protein with PASTA domain